MDEHDYEYNFSVAGRIRVFRENRKKTREDVAKQLKVTPETVRRYEKSERTIPLKYVHRLCDYLDIPVDTLLGRPDPTCVYDLQTELLAYRGEFDKIFDILNKLKQKDHQ